MLIIRHQSHPPLYNVNANVCNNCTETLDENVDADDLSDTSMDMNVYANIKKIRKIRGCGCE